MKKLLTSTALALALGFGGAAFTSPVAMAVETEACSDFGMIDVNDDDLLSETEYSDWGDGVFDDWDSDDDGVLSKAEFDDCYEAGGWYESELDEEWEADAEQLYAAWDDDDDGELTEAEFADEEEFAEWDADDDDALERQEFLLDDFLF